MKKILLTAVVALLGVSAAFAQDLATATEQFNSGLTAFQAGNAQDALSQFEAALAEAQAAGEAGEELATNCKEVLPKVVLKLGKDAAKAKDFDGAIAQFNKAAALATEYGNNSEVVEEVPGLINGIKMSKAQGLAKSNPAEAAAILSEVVAAEPTNGVAQLLYGNVLASQGKTAEAEAALLVAKENGQDAKATKALGSIFLKDCQKLQKAGKFADAAVSAQKSYDYVPSGNALKLLAVSYKSAKKPAEAIAAYERYINEFGAKDPKINETYYAIASLAQEAGLKETAITYYQKVVDDPKFGEYAKAQIKALGA